MASLEFQDLCFEEHGEDIQVSFLRIFYLTISRAELGKIGRSSIKKNSISFPDLSQKRAEKLFIRLLDRSFSNLKSRLTNNPTLYIHKNSGIPLIGSLSFGIVDKGTDMLELKPVTGCNLDCIFCSVDEGSSTKKRLDIVIEKDYLVEETKKLLEYKKKPCHIYINPHGEPLLYADIADLVKGLAESRYVKAVSIITNGSLLTEELAERLIKAGLSHLHVSINSLDPEKAKQLANSHSYDISRIKVVLEKIKSRVSIIISPVLLNGINNDDMEEVVEYCKKNGFSLLIQNFLLNRRGRKPVKELEFGQFYSFLRKLEKKHGIELIKRQPIIHTKELPKPFRKGNIAEVEIVSNSRYPEESLAIADNRIITVKGRFEKHKKQKIMITKDRYNIFYGKKV